MKLVFKSLREGFSIKPCAPLLLRLRRNVTYVTLREKVTNNQENPRPSNLSSDGAISAPHLGQASFRAGPFYPHEHTM